MVHFKDYTTPSSNNKYLLIEADDDTILSKLLTHTLLVSRCANPWTPLVNSLHMPNWTSEHNLDPVRKEKISAHLKSTHNPTGTIPNAEKWSSTDDTTFSKLGVGVKGPSPAETQKEEPPALTQLLSINDHTKTRAIVVMDIVVEILASFSKTPSAIEKHVLRERYEKSKEVSTACKSLEKARKKVKKLKARLDTAKQEAAEMESKVSTVEEEFSECSDVSLATTTASKVVEKKKKVLEATLQDFINYKLYYD
ncbi:hypothetical protein FXO38_26518 [Capsicum annuum]|nr:hypothetical protein FXO38_26518 [Capsicum annuum]